MSDFATLLDSFKKKVETQAFKKKTPDETGKKESDGLKRSPNAMDTTEGDSMATIDQNNGIFVGGLPRGINSGELKDFFHGFGTITHASVTIDRGFGFIQFADGSEGAKKAVEAQPITIRDKFVNVHFYKKRRYTNAGTGYSNNRKPSEKAQDLENALTIITNCLKHVPCGSLSDEILISQIKNCMEKFSNKKARQWTRSEAELAEELLFRLEKEETITLTLQNYANCMNAWAKCDSSQDNAGLRAEKILNRMDERARNDKRLDLVPNRMVINTCIGAYARGSSYQRHLAAEDAERLLTRLEKCYIDTGLPDMRPSDRSYSKVIDAWAGASDPSRAMAVLKRMEEQYVSGNIDAKPNTLCYTSVLDGLAKSGGGRKHAEEAEKIIRHMLSMYKRGMKELKPDRIQFGPVIDAWAKSGVSDASERARGVLNLMLEEGIEPDVVTYNIVINAFASGSNDQSVLEAEKILRNLEENPFVRADRFSYNGVLKAYSNNGEPERAEELLKRWNTEYKYKRVLDQPDKFSFSTTCQAWSRSHCKDSGSKVESIINWMEQNGFTDYANNFCYSACISAYSHDNNTEKSELMLQRLEEKYQSKPSSQDMKPNDFSYCSVIFALARSTDVAGPGKADQCLRQMIKKKIYPDQRCFGSVISGWARSGQPCAPDRCQDLLSLMSSIGCVADTICYNSALHSFVKCKSKIEAGQGAMELFQQMRSEGVQRTSVTYTIMIDACVKEDNLLSRVFETCIEDGMLDNKIAKALSQHHSISIQGDVNVFLNGKSPPNWSCNANRGRKGSSIRQKRAEVEALQSKKRTCTRDSGVEFSGW